MSDTEVVTSTAGGEPVETINNETGNSSFYDFDSDVMNALDELEAQEALHDESEEEESEEIHTETDESDDESVDVDDESEDDTDDEDEDDTDDDVESDEVDEDKDPKTKSADKIKVGDREFGADDIQALLHKEEKLKGADRVLYEAKRAKQDADTILTGIKQNPGYVLQQLGLDVDQLATEHLANKITYEQLPEEQRRMHDQNRQQQMRIQQLEATQTQRQKEMDHANISKLEGEITLEIQEAFKSKSIPENQEVWRRTVAIMADGADRGEVVDASTAMDLAVKSLKSLIDTFLPNSEPDLLEKMLGEETLQKVRQNSIKKVKENAIKKSPKKTVNPNKDKPRSKRKNADRIIRPDEFMNDLANI